MPEIKFISATRVSSMDEFLAESLTSRSIHRLAPLKPLRILVDLGSKDGLADFYNQQIDEAHPDDILIFVHDDVWFDDWLLAYRLEEALNTFDVVGVAGNEVRFPNQRGWYGTKVVPEETFTPVGMPHFAIGMLNPPHTHQNVAAIEAKLLDGVFIATKAKTLQHKHIRFDPQFKYHHYDMDFCRQCELAGLKMGVWPIAMTHAPTSGDLSQTWFDSGTRYLNKWGS